MSNLSKREKVLLFSAAFLILVYFYYKFYILAILTKIDELNLSINSYKQQYTLLNSQNTQNHDLDIKNLEKKYEISIKSIPEYEKNPDIAINIKSIADQINIVLVDLIIDEPYLLEQNQENSESFKMDNFSKEINLSVVPVKAIIKGDIEGIINFLSLIEKNERIAIINNIDINKDEQNSFQALISINYYFSNKGEVY